MSIRAEGDLSTAFFDVPFSRQRAPGKTDTYTIATVWRRRGGDWKLTQSLNCVPTVGLSAKAIIQKDGFVFGSFCAIDRKLWAWTEAEVELTAELTELVATEVAMRWKDVANDLQAIAGPLPCE